MSDWSTPKSIKHSLMKKWEKGDILRQALLNDEYFPIEMKLTYPNSIAINSNFSEVIDWISLLKKHDKASIGYGYTIIYKEFTHRLSGKNMIPTHIVIPTLSDAIKLLNKEDELNLFLSNVDKLLNKWIILKEWIIKYPFKSIKIAADCDCILNILEWFSTHQDRALYLRQLDIEGVDTKFIETNKGLLSELLDLILPEDQINKESNLFEERYKLKRKPPLVRFRTLDKRYTLSGLTDITVPLSEFIQWETPISRFFFTENEINFVSFPQTSDACVVFGRGYGVDLFKLVPWLENKELYYWGDIDTHGFNILSLARSFLPQITSFLMTEEILLSHQPLWVSESKQVAFRIGRLNDDEFNLVCKLQSDYWGKGVRLEQERIKFSYVVKFIESLKQKNDR